MLEVILDTETTGLSTSEKHRIVEIGCVELNNQISTNKIFHEYINPERLVSEEAYKIHGYSDEFLSDKKTFSEISEDLAMIEEEAKNRFEKTIQAIQAQDVEIAQSLMEGYKEQMTGKADEIVNGILKDELHFGSEARTASIALYTRYLKRIGAHLKNITTTLVNPFDAIGYKE